VRKFRDVTDGLLGRSTADDLISLLLEGAQTQSVSVLLAKLRSATTELMRSA
jgi:hypothetical protein